jgi:hypothetical protein
LVKNFFLSLIKEGLCNKVNHFQLLFSSEVQTMSEGKMPINVQQQESNVNILLILFRRPKQEES